MLINPNNPNPATEDTDPMFAHREKCLHFISAEVERDLRKSIGSLQDEHSYHFDTGTKWNLHDIVVYLIREIGPVQLYFSTYAMKIYQATMLVEMKAEGMITEIHALLDYRNEVLDAEAMQLLRENCNSIGLMRTHSKLTVLIGNTLSATITGSANFTRNTNADTGVITIHSALALHRKQWITKHINEYDTHN